MAYHEIEIVQGDDALLEFTVSLGGEDYSLTGGSARFAIKRQPSEPEDDTSALIYRTESDGITIANNVATVEIGAEATRALPVGEYLFSLRVTTAENVSTTVADGVVKCWRRPVWGQP